MELSRPTGHFPWVHAGSMTSIEAVSDEPEAWFKLDQDGKKLAVGGSWTIGESARLDRELNALKPAEGGLEIDASQVSHQRCGKILE